LKILFRVDSTKSGGTGHMSRCLALAEEFVKHDFSVSLLGNFHEVSWMKKRIEEMDLEAFSCNRAELSQSKITDISPDLIIFDSYEFETNLVSLILNEYRSLVLLDHHHPNVDADVFLNQNLGAESIDFNFLNNSKSKVLLGSRYALIRDSLSKIRDLYELKTTTEPVVTCFLGGSDHENRILEVAEFVTKLPLGPKFYFLSDKSNHLGIKRIMGEHDLELMTLSTRLDSVLLDSDLVVSAAGSSVLELMSIGIPTAYLTVADNQIPNMEAITSSNAGLILTGSADSKIDPKSLDDITSYLYDDSKRRNLHSHMRELVDGKGKIRIFESVIEIL
jgi:spore coat polysaccharide biosynthesis predicted glycosyltransferase SpsG